MFDAFYLDISPKILGHCARKEQNNDQEPEA
jgi:hypothetical protein